MTALSEAREYLRGGQMRCEKQTPYRSDGMSGGRCSRDAKDAEIEKLYGGQEERIRYYCTQHSSAYAQQVQERRSNRQRAASNHASTKFRVEQAGRLALKLLRLQGAYGLSEYSVIPERNIEADTEILKEEIKRQFPDAPSW